MLSLINHAFNRIPVMAPILAPILGVHFLKGHFSLKNGTICPLISHDSSSFKDTCFLTKSENERKMLCMGRTFTIARPYLLNNCPFQLSFSWESNPARVKASERGAKCYPRGCYFSLKQDSCYGADIGANIGGTFFWGHISLKMGRFAPFLATIQAISKTRVFLHT
jgi:hypothetical protein